MTEYIGRKGNNVYLINREFNEAYLFNRMGKPISASSANLAILECGTKLNRVNLISILGKQCGKQCEVYFDGLACKVNCNYLSAFSTLRDVVPREEHLLYKLIYPEEVTQILIPATYNSMSKESISRLIPVLQWRTLF